MSDVIRELLISGKEFTKTKYERLKKGLVQTFDIWLFDKNK